MIALDTEDDSKGHVRLINFYDGREHVTFSGPRKQVRAWNYLIEKGKEIVWATNLEYDLINLFGAWLAKMVTLQYVSAGILRGSMKDAPIVFYDTLRHWPASVQRMGEIIGLPKMPQDFRSVEYCRRDTEIVWRFVDEMLRRYDVLGLKLRPTLPGMALQLWRQLEQRESAELPQEIVNYFREGYYGGRVEVYKHGEVKGPIYHYDVNSLFPFVMANQRYPMLGDWTATQTPNFYHQEGMATISVRYPKTFYPCLPVKTRDEIIYPYGFFLGTWTYPEIRQAIADGAEICDVANAIEFRRGEHPFRKFVSFCYQRRMNSENEVDRLFWKLFMNSLYGKFGQRRGLTVIYNDREFTLDTQASHVNVIWSAYVTSYARLHLLSLLRHAGDVYYTDTDSLFTNHRMPTGKALGDLKEEGVYNTAQFYGNKLYIAGGTIKAKGVKGHDAARDFLRTGRCVYRKPARFRESRRSFATANVWYTVEKHMDSTYTKRKILADGWSEPWDWADYERVILPRL